MALSGTRLIGTLYTDILAQLQAYFPVNGGLLPQEQTDYATGQENIANALSKAIGPDVVTEITGFALVPGITAGGATTVVT